MKNNNKMTIEFFECTIVIIFIPINLNMCFGTHYNGSKSEVHMKKV